MFCKQCGKPINDGEELCEDCKASENAKASENTTNESSSVNETAQPSSGSTVNPNAKSKIAAGLLQLFLGSFGVGRFYLGYTGIGVAQILVTWLTCGIGAIWPFIDAILILTGSVNTDADGNPLRD
ncbi:MAG: TM2 domain-containing protein [Clostridia bacterium]|nr:TM2 domain-containing protein [Clostridia bacterium]